MVALALLRCYSGLTYWHWLVVHLHPSSSRRYVAVCSCSTPLCPASLRQQTLLPALCPQSTQQVIIWDDHQNKVVGELSFSSAVKAVKLRRDRIVVVLSNRTYLYNFSDLTLLDNIETADNMEGLVAVSTDVDHCVIAVPNVTKGHVHVQDYDLREHRLISAHESHLACLAMSSNGRRLATASEKGTLIRVFDTRTRAVLQELRRGTEKARIYSIAFSPDCKWLACTSDKGTVHVFKLNEAVYSMDRVTDGADHAASSSASVGSAGAPAGAGAGSAAPTEPAGAAGASAAAAASPAAGSTNNRSSLSFMSGVLPSYFSSEWSHAQFKVKPGKSIVAFGLEPYTIMVVTGEGVYYRAKFRDGGEMERLQMTNFFP